MVRIDLRKYTKHELSVIINTTEALYWKAFNCKDINIFLNRLRVDYAFDVEQKLNAYNTVEFIKEEGAYYGNK